jgi:hypothetical protein
MGADGIYELRERDVSYNPNFAGENSGLRPENSYFGDLLNFNKSKSPKVPTLSRNNSPPQDQFLFDRKKSRPKRQITCRHESIPSSILLELNANHKIF